MTEGAVIEIGMVERDALRLPEKFDTYAAIARENFTPVENTGTNPGLENKYSERLRARDGNTKIDIHLREPDSQTKPERLQVGQNQEVSIIARVWFTQKNADTGHNSAVVYKLGEDGKWYKQTADSYRYDADKKTNYWNLNPEAQTVDDAEEQLMLKSRLEKIKK